MAQEIPYNRPYLTGRELDYIRDSHHRGQLAGDGYHTKACEQILQKATSAQRVLSCTAALEMAAILFNINEGDEVILPSYTFVSTANAFVLRGATPVFVDIRPDTLNIDENQIEKAITNRTRAIAPIHYAGISCEMEKITEIAQRHRLRIVEDAAQGMQAQYHGQPLGSMGDLGILDQEHHFRRRRCPPDKRSQTRGKSRAPSRKRHKSCAVFPGPSGQVHLGGHWLLLYSGGNHCCIPACTTGRGRFHHQPASPTLGCIPSRHWSLWSWLAGSADPLSRDTAGTTRTSTMLSLKRVNTGTG
jgi:hypothetical protein